MVNYAVSICTGPFSQGIGCVFRGFIFYVPTYIFHKVFYRFLLANQYKYIDKHLLRTLI